MFHQVIGEEMGGKPRVVVAMLGARMHYALPRVLARAGLLERFFTDSFAGTKPKFARWLGTVPSAIAPNSVRRWLGRQDDALPSSCVTSFELLGLRYAYARRLARSSVSLDRVYATTSRRFARAIAQHGLGEGNIVWGFNTASVELFTFAKAAGRMCILEQTILPAKLEHEILAEVARDLPDWQPDVAHARGGSLQEIREGKEWALADHIVVASNFVRDGLLSSGVHANKISVVPYGVDQQRFSPPPSPFSHDEPLRVLFVGEVGLRKGTPYLLEALRQLGPTKVQARFAGRVVLNRSKLEPYRNVARLLGPVPRTEMSRLYAWADVFVLPSTVEGSATASYEALMSGLPQIVTPSTGSIISGGDAGIVVPARDTEALAGALDRYAGDRSLLLRHGKGATILRNVASIERYGNDICELLYSLTAGDR